MKEKKYCLNCGKEISGREKRNNLFCSIECYYEHKKTQKEERIKNWSEGNEDGCVGLEKNLSDVIREYLLKIHDYKCELCGWGEKNKFTNKIPLEIHHIDGKHINNKRENLQVLCPNCHSLTQKQRGKGTSTRILRYNKELKKKLKEQKQKKEEKKIILVESKNPGKEKLLELLKNNNINQIAKGLEVSYNCIVKWLKKYELPHKKEDLDRFLGKEMKQKKIRKKTILLTKEKLEQIRENKEQKTYTELAKEFDTNRFTISKIINNKAYKEKTK